MPSSKTTKLRLLDAAEKGDLEALKKWRAQNRHTSVNAIRSADSYATPLHNACKGDKLAAVQFLITSCDADLTSRNKKGCTPLHVSCRAGALSVLKYLVEVHQVDITARNESGKTAFQVACGYNRIACMKYLVESCSADANLQNSKGDTPLHDACRFNRFTVVKYLVESCGCNVDIRNNFGDTPMDLARMRKNERVIEYLQTKCGTSQVGQPKRMSTTKANKTNQANPKHQRHRRQHDSSSSEYEATWASNINVNHDRLRALKHQFAADLTLLVGHVDERQMIKVNSGVLLTAVPGIEAVLDQGIVDQSTALQFDTKSNTTIATTTNTIILLPDNKPKDVKNILRFIYGNDTSFLRQDGVTQQDLLDLIPVATTFRCWKLKLIIEATLIRKHMTQETLVDLLVFAEQHGCFMLKDAGVRKAAQDTSALFCHPKFGLLVGHTELLAEIRSQFDDSNTSPGANSMHEDEWSRMSVGELYKELFKQGHELLTVDLDRASLLEMVRAVKSNSTSLESVDEWVNE